jgi:CRISPR-associated protein Cas1
LPFRNAKTQKIILDGQGGYLSMQKGAFVVKDDKGTVERYPLFEKEIGEVILKSGNAVSTGALASCGFWNVDVLIMTQRGRPVAMLKSLEDDSHVSTRLAQYKALDNGKGIAIAKQLVKSKVEGENMVLRKYGLRPLDNSIENVDSESLESIRKRFMVIESQFARLYFQQIFGLFSERIRPRARTGFKAYDGINNLFNLAYEMLSWKCHKALVNAKLECYLGFLHSEQFGKPSLVCDFMELYRYLIDDFVIQYLARANIRKKDFITKPEALSKGKSARENISTIVIQEIS